MNYSDLQKAIASFNGNNGSSDFTIEDSFQNIGCFGLTGSGKTSGSFKFFLSKFLKNDYGGLILTAKADDRKAIEQYIAEANRLDDLIVVEPGGSHTFNFIEHVAKQAAKGVSSTDNLVHVLKTVIRASEEKTDGKGDDAFWQKSQDALISHVIKLCLLAYSEISIKSMYEIAASAPHKDADNSNKEHNAFLAAYDIAHKKVMSQVEEFESNLTEEQKQKLDDKVSFENAILEALPDARTLKELDQFFLVRYRNLAERTRSIIDFSFTGFLHKLMQEPVYSLFCNTRSTFTPEMCFDGKIILIDLPVRVYNESGRDAQILFKYIWQRSMEKRSVHDKPRPVFLAVDECHLFLHEYDAEFLATARSSRVANLLVTQTIPSYYASMSDAKAEYRVKALLGNMATKIFHLNTCADTNNYASDLIGEVYIEDVHKSSSLTGEYSLSESRSFKLEKMVRPEALTKLKSGGARNNLEVEAYVHRAGVQFANSQNHAKITFKQRIHL